MLLALKSLDHHLDVPTKLLIGGGAAMLLAYGFPVSTLDIDGLVFQSDITQVELDPLVKAVAKEHALPADWLNSYFNTFLFALPRDYGSRLFQIFSGQQLTVYALSMEDLLVLKCFAGRQKDVGHARALLRKIPDYRIVEDHLHAARDRNLPGAEAAITFFEDLLEDVGI